MNYQLLCDQTKALFQGENDSTAILSNSSALLWDALENINWVGFYLYKQEQLILGPFQGKVACMRIPMGRGVCGTSAQTRTIQRVSDVHQFEGHIACDSASESEIVLPLVKNGKLIGVLDIDAPIKDRFSQEDEEGLAKFVEVLLTFL